MRIAQVAPLCESVPPRLYGGTERVVAWLTDELVRLGHDVTLYASGDSGTLARLVPCAPCALRLAPDVDDVLPHHLAMLGALQRGAERYDVVHFHLDQVHLPLARSWPGPTVTTLHGRLDLPGLRQLHAEFSEVPLVSISRAQRQPLPPGLNWAGCVPHGMPPDLFQPPPAPRSEELVFLGRVSPEKGLADALEIARRARMPLRIAAKIDRHDRDHFDSVLAPRLHRRDDVRFLGEVDDAVKKDLLGHARALLFPIDWPEPFGLVLIEAMACGTPVIAYPRGSVPEIVEDGVTGRIVDGIDAAVAAVEEVAGYPRGRIRACFERRYTASRMARDYVAIYESLARAVSRAGRSPASMAGRRVGAR
jgi:glycosyltransferase involved in cell wall biosynthesis